MSPRMLVTLSGISITLHDTSLVTGLSFSVASGAIVALVGANGCGKSTLLDFLHRRIRGLAVDTAPDRPLVHGSTALAPHLSVGYLHQMIRVSAPRELTQLHASSENAHLMSSAASLARGFGLDDIERPLDRYSDGELQKLALSVILSSEADLLLLDEPTNYLDIVGLTALEESLARLSHRGCGIVIVTHDRTLTDNVSDETILLTREQCYRVPGGATAVWQAREDDVSSREHQAAQIKRKIRQLQEDAQRKAAWAERKEASKRGAKAEKPFIAKRAAKLNKRAKQAERRTEKEVQRLESTRPFVPKAVHLSLPERKVRTRQVFSLEEVRFEYSAGSVILDEIALAARADDKLCLMGANGGGKTTLLKVILRQLIPTSGRAVLNSSVPTAYIPQGLAGFFDRHILLDNFADCPQSESEVRGALGAVQLRREKVLEPASHFSYGELMRAAVVKCLLSGAEFLILDEPTSHLDIESIQVLERLLQEFDGGFLIVSHDRSFVSAVADRLFVLDAGRLREV